MQNHSGYVPGALWSHSVCYQWREPEVGTLFLRTLKCFILCSLIWCNDVISTERESRGGTYWVTSSPKSFFVFHSKSALRNRLAHLMRCCHNKHVYFDRSAITILPKRTDGQHDFRVWNTQLIRYAGYKMADGTIIGDPDSVDFTKVDICLYCTFLFYV